MNELRIKLQKVDKICGRTVNSLKLADDIVFCKEKEEVV